MKIHLVKICLLLSLCMVISLRAEPASQASPAAKMLVYIQAIEYSNPIYLWQPYDGRWVLQGPLLEAQAMAKFSQVYPDVGLCEGYQSGKALIWMQPRIFYNPQVQRFYGKVTANVYNGMGHFVASYVGEASLQGLLDSATDDSLSKTYAQSIDVVLAQMQADSALQAMLANVSPSVADATPCSMVSLLPIPKIRVMSF